MDIELVENEVKTEFIQALSWDYKVFPLIKYLKGHKGFIAGGTFKNLFNGEPIRDIDIFFRNREDLLEAISVYSESSSFRRIFENERVKAFKHKETETTVELIGSRSEDTDATVDLFGEPEEILRKFDFTIVKFALYSDTDKEGERIYNVTFSTRFFEHLTLRRLIIDDQLLLPINTFERALKYTKYGYGLCRESKARLVTAIQQSTLDPNSNMTQTLYDGLD